MPHPPTNRTPFSGAAGERVCVCGPGVCVEYARAAVPGALLSPGHLRPARHHRQEALGAVDLAFLRSIHCHVDV
eukprot:1232341-Pyramimonas_sp.AAC.1